MNATIDKKTIQIVKDIDTHGNDLKDEFTEFVETISNRDPISLSVPLIDLTVEDHYSVIKYFDREISDLSDSIDYSSNSEKMNELKSILKEDLNSDFFDYIFYLQEYRIDLRLGMSTQVETFIRNIVDDLDRLNQWLLSA